LSVQSLCTRAIVLREGKVIFDGVPEQAVTDYLASTDEAQTPLESHRNRVGGEAFRFTSVQFLHPDRMVPLDVLISGQPVIIRIGYVNRTDQPITDIGCGIAFFTLGGAHLSGFRSRAVGVTVDACVSSGYTDCLVPKWPFSAGRYYYHLYAERGGSNSLDWIPDAGVVQVEPGDYYGTGVLPSSERQGVFVDYNWIGNNHKPALGTATAQPSDCPKQNFPT